MAFNFVRNMISGQPPVAPPKDNESYKLASGQTVVAGTALKFSGGEVTAASGTDKDAAVIALEGGTNKAYIRCQWIMPGNVYKTTAAADTPTVGQTYKIATGGVGLDSADARGALTLIKKSGTTMWVVFNSCAAVLDVSS